MKRLALTVFLVCALWGVSSFAIPKQQGRVTGVGAQVFSPSSNWQFWSVQCFDWQTDAGPADPNVVFCGGGRLVDGGVGNCTNGKATPPPLSNGPLIKFSSNSDAWLFNTRIGASTASSDSTFSVVASDAGSVNCVFSLTCDDKVPPSCP